MQAPIKNKGIKSDYVQFMIMKQAYIFKYKKCQAFLQKHSMARHTLFYSQLQANTSLDHGTNITGF
jgi:hypothetical protein